MQRIRYRLAAAAMAGSWPIATSSPSDASHSAPTGTHAAQQMSSARCSSRPGRAGEGAGVVEP
jgi:hypothetical protein